MNLKIGILLLFAIALSGQAQTGSTAPCLHTTRFDAASDAIQTVDCHGKVLKQNSLRSSDAAASQDGPTVGVSDSKLGKSTQEFAIWQNDYTRRIFEHQNTYTVFIFIIVNLLVIAGLYFAWIQFRSTLHLGDYLQSHAAATVAKAPANAPEGQPETPPVTPPFPDTNLKFGPDGIAISSSFIGLIILGFAMGFYLMYLKYVYPIHTAAPDTPASVQPSAAGK